MRKLLIRHEISEANNRDNWGTEAFGHRDAPLMQLGISRTPNIRHKLMNSYDIDIQSSRVAISSMLRSRHTAFYTGFRQFKTYPELDEIPMNIDEIIAAKRTRTPPQNAIDYVSKLLENPPEEEIWFTHGFVIATICHVKGIEYPIFIPSFGEIRPVEFAEAA